MTIVRYDTSPIGTGKNWVTKTDPVEGLGSFVRAIVHALMRSGHPKGEAIAIAEGVIKKWAAGKGTWGKSHHVTPQTQAKAQQAVAHWEALKAAAHAERYDDFDMQFRAGKAGPAGSADAKAQNKGAASRKSAGNQAGGTKLKGDHAPGHKFYGNQHTKVGSTPNAPVQTVGTKVPTGGGNASPGSALSALGNPADAKAGAQATAAAAAQQAQQSVQDVQSATHEYQSAKASVVKSQTALEMAIAQSKQDVKFAQGREGAIAGVSDNGQQTKSVTLASAGRIQAAKNNLANAQLRLSAAQDSLGNSLKAAKPKHVTAVAAYANAATTRDDEGEIEVRKLWGRDLPGHREHGDAMKASEKAMESPSKKGFAEAAAKHAEAARALHEQGEHATHEQSHADAVFAYRAARSHAKVAGLMRHAADDSVLDQKEDIAIKRAREQVSADFDAYSATSRSIVRDTPEPLLRDFVGEGNPAGVGDTSGASHFLPAGPSKKQSAAITHRFVGSDLNKCGRCGKPVANTIHKGGPGQPIAPRPREALGLRHRGTEGHERTSTGHVKGVPARHQQAAKARNLRNFDSIEEPLTASLKKHFEAQRSATVNRLMGKRGAQMLKRAAQPPEPPPEPPPGSEILPVVSTGSVFDAAHWADLTADVLTPHLQHAATLAAAEVAKQLAITEADDAVAQKVWPGGSDSPLKAIIAQRAADAAQHITATTTSQLTDALQQGVANGEGRDAIAKRINDVFDHADMVRAKQIAQTETVGAYNQAQTDYASSLPLKVAGNKVWLAHDDDRTRPTHRMANGQERPMGAQYVVGSAQMSYPGDKTAPIGEWINCRCSQAFLPNGMTYAPLAAAAQAYVDAVNANKPPPPESPYKTGEAA